MISGLLRVFAVAAIVLVTGARLAPERAMAAKFAFHDVVVVDTDLLNVRSNPGTDGSIRLTIRQGIRLMIVDGPKDDDGYTWYKVNILGDSDEAPLTGWVAQDFITLEEQGLNINNANWVEVNDGPVNMRSGPGRTSRSSTSLTPVRRRMSWPTRVWLLRAITRGSTSARMGAKPDGLRSIS